MPQKLHFFMSYTFEGQFCALMIQFENTNFLKCEYNHLLHIPIFLEMSCFSEIIRNFMSVLKKKQRNMY